MYLPIDANVLCNDRDVGHITCAIVDPIHQAVTDVVVSLSEDGTKRIVPVEWINQTTEDTIYLNCSYQMLTEQRRFAMRKLICLPNYHYRQQDGPARTLFTLYGSRDVEERIPDGELAIHMGARIHAADGRLGTLSELIVDQSNHITHIVLDKSHWYGTLHSLIPVGAIDHIEEDTFFLKLTRDEVAQLPHRRSIRALQSEH